MKSPTVGFGDIALGAAAVLCIWIRDRYWLAILVVATISLWGDAAARERVRARVARSAAEPGDAVAAGRGQLGAKAL